MVLRTALFVSKRLQIVLATVMCLMAGRLAAEALRQKTVAPASAHAVLFVRQSIAISRSGL
jgi:hypothetical protein